MVPVLLLPMDIESFQVSRLRLPKSTNAAEGRSPRQFPTGRQQEEESSLIGRGSEINTRPKSNVALTHDN